MKISYNYKDGREEMIYRTYLKDLDGTCCDIMREVCPQWFLPFQLREDADGCVFIYDISGTINLRAWMDRASEEEKQRMRAEIMEKQQRLWELGVSGEQLLTKERYMYVDRNSVHIRFVCIPLRTDEAREIPIRREGISVEISEKLPPVPPTPSTDIYDMDYHTPEIKQLDMPAAFEYENNEEQSENLYSPWRQEPVGNTGSAFPSFPKEGSEGEKTVFGFMNRQEEVSGKSTQEDEDGTVLMQCVQEDEDATVLMSTVSQPTAFLCHESTGENFRLNRNANMIGRSKTEADICIENAPEIGRKHCRILWENGNYYLEDCHSLNGTYLDGVKLEPGERKVLQDRSRIRIANKAFVLKID